MTAHQNYILVALKHQRDEILQHWFDHQRRNETIDSALVDSADLQRHAAELLDEFASLIESRQLSDITKDDLEQLRDSMRSTARFFDRRGQQPAEIALFILSLKHALLKVLPPHYSDAAELASEVAAISEILDDLGLFCFQVTVEQREATIREQQAELTELSVPVIKLWDNVLVLPIIGTLDSLRAQTLMERLLTRIASTGDRFAIIDISGVPTVDTMTAQHLTKTLRAVQLMGADCVITGLRPDVAQTMVSLGIDLSQFTTRFSLADGFGMCLDRLGLAVQDKRS